MTADGGMAVWGVHKVDAAGEAATEFHFNYWRISTDAASAKANASQKDRPEIQAKDFVEIGVRVHKAAQLDRIVIYLPGIIEHWHIEDCGHRFANQDIAQGIFNLPLSSQAAGPPGPRRYDLIEQNGDRFTRVHVLPTEHGAIDVRQLIQESADKGAILTITPHALQEACFECPDDVPVYFRLRAYYTGPAKQNPFVKTINPRDRVLQSGYNTVEYLDFRLNEVRSLPTRIETLMRQGPGTNVPHTLAAFLTAVPVQSDVTTISWEKVHKKRMLEHDLWAAYVPTGIPSGMTVYHWKEEGTKAKPIEDFSGFVKMQTRLVSWHLLCLSILIAFIFGILGNLAASWIWDRTHPSPIAQDQSSAAQVGTQGPKADKDTPLKPDARQQ